MAIESNALPTLLCSRPRAAENVEALKRRRPAPVALEILEESAETPQPALRIKNTFIEGAARRSPSFETFYRERAVHTCPSKHAGRLANWLEDITAGGNVDVPSASPLGIQTPCSIQTPLADCLAQPQSLPQWFTPATSLLPGYMHTYQAEGFIPDIFAQAVAAPPALHSNLVARPTLSLSSALQPKFEALDQTQSHSPNLQCQASLAQPPPHYSEFLSMPVAPGIGGVDGCGRMQFQAGTVLPQLATRTLESTIASAPASNPELNLIAPVQPPPPPTRPALGTPELPSLGSASHGSGDCKPCAFLYSKGCNSGLVCQFCHLCGPDERKLRRKEKLQTQREANRARRDVQTVRGSDGQAA